VRAELRLKGRQGQRACRQSASAEGRAAGRLLLDKAHAYATERDVNLLAAWAIFTGYMTVGTLKISRALQAVFITLTILFILLAIGVDDGNLMKVAGWEGMICGRTALYASFAIVVNETWGRQVLPIGVVK
jgi:succinate-acetate transporter protein